MQGARIPFLVRELRPYMLQGTAKKKKKNQTNPPNPPISKGIFEHVCSGQVTGNILIG